MRSQNAPVAPGPLPVRVVARLPRLLYPPPWGTLGGLDKEAHLRKLLIAAVLAVMLSLAFSSVASAHVLRYPTAKRLAVKLAQQQEERESIDRWRIFGAERISDHQIVWVYNVDYSDGTLCDAELVVRYQTNSNGRQVIRAFFRDVHCER